jgi:hypothetical protein
MQSQLIRCSGCGESKDATAFTPDRRNRSGFQSWCRDCTRQAGRAREGTPVRRKKQNGYRRDYRRTRREHILALKGTKCMDCNDEFPPGQLHFHHVDPTTKVSKVTALSNGPLSSIDAEAAKCVVLCAACHSARHVRSGGH